MIAGRFTDRRFPTAFKNLRKLALLNLQLEAGVSANLPSTDVGSDQWRIDVSRAEQQAIERLQAPPQQRPESFSTLTPSASSNPVKRCQPTDFTGGTMEFLADRVELCGVDICSGPRSKSKRVVLALLSRRRDVGGFVAYSGEQLENRVEEHGGRGAAAGLIRDLRNQIRARLEMEANIVSKNDDVILSGGPGYRFSERISVQYADQSAITDIRDIVRRVDVRNVPDGDVRDVFDVRDDEAGRRRAWILEQLQNGVQLKAPMVAAQFKRSKKTAQRALDALRDEGKIEFVGDPRTGYYGLCQTPPSDP